ncbi:MAG: hypothetical protein ISS63_04250 [Desulfobacteraceae bacterium]|nr:hypothetical protein [Desulfobacteraceae bacterium]
MKREAKILLGKAIDSLVLSIEHFNRPWDKGREEAVLIFMDRSFELLLKAIIVHRNGKIREARAKGTIGFDKCVRKCVSDPLLNCISEQQAFTIQIINSLRDAAQHYILDISEQQLYIYSQAGATLFNQLLTEVFGKQLSDYIPERVLPISTSPPRDFVAVIDTEFSEIKKLLRPRARKRLEARAKIRSLAIVESSLKGIRTQPSKPHLEGIARQIEKGKNWREIFPGVASLSLDSSGEGPSISIRLTKKEGEAVHLVPEGTPGATVMAIKRVDELGYYCLGLHQLADKLEITPPRLLAVIRKIGLQEDSEYFKTFKIGATEYKRYSPKALQQLRDNLPSLDVDEIWEEDKALRKKIKK